MSKVYTFIWEMVALNAEYVGMNSNRPVLSEKLADPVTHKNFMTFT